MSSSAQRRTHPSPADLKNIALRQRGRAAIAKIITVEAKLDNTEGPVLAFLVALLEWFADMPTGGDRS